MIIVQTRNDRIELWMQNRLVAYVDDETLYAIDGQGDAVRVCEIDHRSQATSKFEEWLYAL